MFDRVNDSLPCVLARGGDMFLPFKQWQAHQQEAGDYRDKAESVQKKTRRHSHGADHQTRSRWTDNARAVYDRAVERDRVQQIFSARHFDRERLARGHVETHRHSVKGRDHDDEDRRRKSRPRAGGEQEGTGHLRALREQENRTFWVKIGKRAAPDREQHQRRRAHSRDRA